mmetsp:Transcript_12107/g.19712  ORF Transcript_12107/g.19712 Transcript_12107/m.19712 type:complete len:171 (-) Transcript_12107:2016-2528(-)
MKRKLEQANIVIPCRKRKPWTNDEDTLLEQVSNELSVLVNRGGEPTTRVPWYKVAQHFDERTAKQCRDRFTNRIQNRCNTCKKAWTKSEDELLLSLQDEYKNRWVKIATYFPGRNDNMVKSRFRLLNENQVLISEVNSENYNTMNEIAQPAPMGKDKEFSEWCDTLLSIL